MNLSFYCQACINSYKGMYGEVKPIFNKEEDFDIDGIKGIFGEMNDGILHVVFQGSIEFSDWVDNFRFLKTDFICGSVHRGFLEEYETIRDLVYKKACYFNSIHFTGHSLGGALASLFALDLGRGKSVTSVTFGSPRVGDNDFVNCHDDYVKSYRVVNACDVVPRFPILGYSHVAGLVEIGAKKWYRRLGSIRDHHPVNYLENLRLSNL